MEKSKVKSAFELFPKEIWEMILNEVEDSKDILTVLRALPDLDMLIDKQKRFWLIDRILPFLYNLIDENDVLNLRLVCKQWQRRVDHFLPNQPCCRAYSEELHKDNRNHWDYLEEYKNNWFWARGYAIYPNMDEERTPLIVRRVMEHPRARNPFVYRSLFIDISRDEEELTDFENIQFQEMFPILDRFGTHLRFLQLNLNTPALTWEVFNLIGILKLTPNLINLQLHFLFKVDFPENRLGHYSDDAAAFLEERLPELPLLERVEIEEEGDGDDLYSQKFKEGLFKRYGSQIRRIRMAVHRWNVEEFKNLFPKLTELNLYVCTTFAKVSVGREFKDLATLRRLFRDISAPNLARLQLHFSHFRATLPISIEDILEWLKRFPQIKFFEITRLCFFHTADETGRLFWEEKGTANPEKDRIPSLQTLKIMHGHGLSYNFLRCFPSLRHLVIKDNSCPTVVDLSMPDPFKLREQIQTGKLYESNIWEMGPKRLNTIYLQASLEDIRKYNFSFSRETYEKLKKLGRIPSEPQMHPFRKDILDYIQASADFERR